MASERPLVTFDLDGVLCRPPFGINPGKLKAKPLTTPGSRDLLWFTELVRYFGRSPMPGAPAGMRRVSEFAECVVVTARGHHARSQTERWLTKNLGYLPLLYMRTDHRERPPQFKARVTRELQAAAHFEDDPNTAVLLAEERPVFMVDWPRNHGVERENVYRVRSVADALDRLHEVIGA